MDYLLVKGKAKSGTSIIFKMQVSRLNINLNVYNNGDLFYLRKSLFQCVVNKHIDLN